MAAPAPGLVALTLDGLRTCVAPCVDLSQAGSATVPKRMRNWLQSARLVEIFETKVYAVTFRLVVENLCKAIVRARAGSLDCADGDVPTGELPAAASALASRGSESTSELSGPSETAGPVVQLDRCLSAIALQRGQYTKAHTLRAMEAVYDLPPGALCTPTARESPMSSHNKSAYKRFRQLKMGVQEANAFLHMLVPAARAPALQQLVMCELQALYEDMEGATGQPFFSRPAVQRAVTAWHEARDWDHQARGVCASAVDIWAALKRTPRPPGWQLRRLDIAAFASVVAPSGLLSLKLPLVDRAADVHALRQLRDALEAMAPRPDAHKVAHCLLVGHLLWSPERVGQWREFLLSPAGPFVRLCLADRQRKHARRQRRQARAPSAPPRKPDKKVRRRRRHAPVTVPAADTAAPPPPAAPSPPAQAANKRRRTSPSAPPPAGLETLAGTGAALAV